MNRIRTSSYLLLVAIWLWPTGSDAQVQPSDLTYDYQQFLNTRDARLRFNPSSPFQINPVFIDLDVQVNSQYQIGSIGQFRDEITLNMGVTYPWSDSIAVFVKANQLALFSEQGDSRFKTLNLSYLAGGDVKTTAGLFSLSAGPWITEQLTYQETGTNLMAAHYLQTDLGGLLAAESNFLADWKTGDRRKNQKLQYGLVIRPEIDQPAEIRYLHQTFLTDYLVGQPGPFGPDLNYRNQVIDNLSILFEQPVTDRLILSYNGDFRNRSINRTSDLASANNPDFTVKTFETLHEARLAFRGRQWQPAVSFRIEESQETYAVDAETPGLSGPLFDIQSNKFRKRNLDQTQVRLSPYLRYQFETWQLDTETLISVSKQFNPENNNLEDRDIGTLGWRMSGSNRMMNQNQWMRGSIELQYSRYIFIHPDRSGDTHRNHFIKLDMEWKTPVIAGIHNYTGVKISSQIRTYDFDDLFLIRKSFIYRQLTVSDSLKWQSPWYSPNELVIRFNQSGQGAFNADRFGENPSRSIRSIEGEIAWVPTPSHFRLSIKMALLEQENYANDRWQIEQIIRQIGPFFSGFLTFAHSRFTLNSWFLFYSDKPSVYRFLPNINLNYSVMF